MLTNSVWYLGVGGYSHCLVLVPMLDQWHNFSYDYDIIIQIL